MTKVKMLILIAMLMALTGCYEPGCCCEGKKNTWPPMFVNADAVDMNE